MKCYFETYWIHARSNDAPSHLNSRQRYEQLSFLRIKVHGWGIIQPLYVCANTHFDLEELIIVYIVYKLMIVYKHTNSLMTKWSMSGASLLRSGENLRLFIALVSLEVAWGIVRTNMDSQWNVLKCMSSIYLVNDVYLQQTCGQRSTMVAGS